MSHPKDTAVVKVDTDTRFMYVTLDIAGKAHFYKMPKETLSIRAAEYDLDVEHDDPLDFVLRELWVPDVRPEVSTPGHPHPLYTASSIAEAHEEVNGMIEDVRVDRKAPADETGNRLLAGAVRNKACTKGLVQTRDSMLFMHDPRIVEPVQYFRDQQREIVAREPEEPALVDQMLRDMDREKKRALEMSRRDKKTPLPK